MRIRIVFLLGTLRMGGTERQFLETIRRLDRRRFDPRVLALPDSGPIRAEIEALGVPVARLGMPPAQGAFRLSSLFHVLRMFRDVLRYLRRERPHILQSYQFWTNIYASVAGKIAGTPVILTGRRESLDPKYRRVWKLALRDLSNRWATAILANSERVRAECLRAERFLAPEKIQVIYNGVDFARYAVPQASLAIKAALNFPNDAPVVGVIARLHPRKGHRDFLNAAAIILRQQPDARFLLVGADQGMRPELEALASELGIADAVAFTGEQQEIPTLLAAIDILVSCSRIEGLSNAIMEGMAAGKAIIATNIDGTPELVRHEETGLLIPQGDPAQLAATALRLLHDSALRRRLGDAARERAKTLFQMDNMIQQTEAFYERCLRQAQSVDA